MIYRFSKHFIVHDHEDGRWHHAHALSLAALFAYLQIFLIVVAGLYFIRMRAPQILGTASYSADQIIALTNQKRAESGLPALSTNGLLAQAAAAKAADMFVDNYWAHNSPSGKTPWSFIAAAGYKYVYAGENLARDFGDPDSVVNAWMASPSHRSNLLDRNFKEIGVAVSDGKLEGREGILVVQMFGSAISLVPVEQNLAQVLPTPQPSPTGTGQLKAKPSPLPSVVVSPTPSPTPTQVPVAVVNPPASVNLGSVPVPATVLASRQFSIAKGITLALVGFMFLLFALEVLMVARRSHLKLRPGVLAHLGLLGFLLLVIWYAVQGAVI